MYIAASILECVLIGDEKNYVIFTSLHERISSTSFFQQKKVEYENKYAIFI